MKKTILSIAICLLSFTLRVNAQQSPNPIVYRLSSAEIAQCITPSAVAYNFIESILCRDYERMLSYVCYEYKKGIIQWIQEMNCSPDHFFARQFSEQGGEKLNILGWIPALAKNYEVAIAYVQDEWYYEENGSWYWNPDQIVKDGMIYLPGETVGRIGILEKKVYVTCSPTAEVNNIGFQDITRYGNTNVKVLLQKFDGVWKVTGFK